MKDKSDIIIVGVGGQGILSLSYILAELVMEEGYEVKQTETHGLSQKKGSVISHLRYGYKVYSPLVAYGRADLVIGLDRL